MSNVKYLPIKSKLFENNRKNFVKKLKKNSIAIFHSNDEMPRSADQVYDFKQDPDLFYLSGIDQEQTALILFPEHPNKAYREILFVRETSEHIKVWEGYKLTKDQAAKNSGIKTIKWAHEFDTILNMVVNAADNIYLNLNEHDRSGSKQVPYKSLRFAKEMKEKFPLHEFDRAAPIMADLRAVKSKEEVELMQKACDITEKGVRRILKFIKPGVMEYEIEAELTHEFLSNRSAGHAYHPIIASGADACILHYGNNNKKCKDGDLILMDFGAEYANYRSDLTRTFPVNGKFTARQKAVYNGVLRAFRTAEKNLVPGKTMADINKAVSKVLEEECIKLKLFTKADLKKQKHPFQLLKKYFPHGNSHHIGLDVHDVGDRHMKIKPGMVFTNEPGLYLWDEGIGVRIENDFLVTKGKPIDLMANIPIEIKDIERLMKK